MDEPISIPLPLIDLPEPQPALEWARLPFALGPSVQPLPDAALSCLIETLNGAAMSAELVAFDIARAEIGLRTAPDRPPLAMPFSRFRRLTLTAPVALPHPTAGAMLDRGRDDTQSRDYRVELAAGGFIDGRTIGQARHEAGWFFFSPTDRPSQVMRQFVPAAVAARMSFGATDLERAREHWINTAEELRAAVAGQAQHRPKPLGVALVELGLTRREDIDRTLDEQRAGNPQALGQMLLERGLIEQQDLQIALAHKMGVALVDISRFPIDRSLVAGLPQDVLRECHALPLLRIGQRLVVAIDDLARLAQLQHHRALTGLQVEPALALRKELAPLLAQHIGPGRKDPWAANVPFLR